MDTKITNNLFTADTVEIFESFLLLESHVTLGTSQDVFDTSNCRTDPLELALKTPIATKNATNTAKMSTWANDSTEKTSMCRTVDTGIMTLQTQGRPASTEQGVVGQRNSAETLSILASFHFLSFGK